ncbi:MAG: hypothetical protein LBK58_04955 [Prevotellaceae bacterium]|jgi:uncharacterized protein YjgD (DUF1641 family)|nr:hypothetical protein [Prevotellaceae bacterium]
MNNDIRERIRQEAEKELSSEDCAIWETIEELSKENKLKVLNGILPNYNGRHICTAISDVAWYEDFITNEQYWSSISLIANKLIPELTLLEPESEDTETRRQVLKDLIELIKNQSE